MANFDVIYALCYNKNCIINSLYSFLICSFITRYFLSFKGFNAILCKEYFELITIFFSSFS